MRKKTKMAKKRTRPTSSNKKRPGMVTVKPKVRFCEYPLPMNYLLEEHPEL